MKLAFSGMWWARRLALGAALFALPTLVHAAPVIDGVLDPEYGSALATSPKDDLTVDPALSINDPADPTAKTLDSTALYATNSGNSLYLYVRLPYYNMQTSHGDWAITVHLGGANDAIMVSNQTKDPYGINVFYNYPSNPNAVIKANVVSAANFSDGVNGWAYINTPNAALNGWQFNMGDYFGSAAQGKPTTTQTLFHSVGGTGSEIAYANGDGTGNNGGIEMKIPFVDFAHDGNLTAPKVGDVVKLQFYDSLRAADNSHPRAAIDTEPFELDARSQSSDYSTGVLTQQVSYTIKSAITPMDVQSASDVDLTNVKVYFTDNLGTGATTASNYTLVDASAGNAPVAVTAAAVDATNTKLVNLTTASLQYGHQYKLTVSNVQSNGGVTVTPEKNTATFYAVVPVTFNLYDPKGVIESNAPPAPAPLKVTVTGSFINWTNNADGSGEIPLTLVDAATHHWQSAPVLVVPPGGNNLIEYKYRMPGTGADPWNVLQGAGNNNNPDNRAFMLPPLTQAVNTNDYVETTDIVNVTFNLVDNENRAAGQDVYLAGMYINNYNFGTAAGGATTAIKMTKTGTNTYSVTVPVPQGYDRYKYFTAVPDSTDPTKLVPNYDIFTQPNLYATISGTGTPLAQTITDIIGVATPNYLKALRIAGGLESAPSSTDPAFAALNVVNTGSSANKIDLVDAVTLFRQSH